MSRYFAVAARAARAGGVARAGVAARAGGGGGVAGVAGAGAADTADTAVAADTADTDGAGAGVLDTGAAVDVCRVDHSNMPRRHYNACYYVDVLHQHWAHDSQHAGCRYRRRRAQFDHLYYALSQILVLHHVL